MPVRLRPSHDRGWKKPPGTVVVARPSGFGNPWAAGPGLTAAQAVDLYRRWLAGAECSPALAARRAAVLARLPELRGKDLLCWCRPDEPCHADVLLDLANRSAG